MYLLAGYLVIYYIHGTCSVLRSGKFYTSKSLRISTPTKHRLLAATKPTACHTAYPSHSFLVRKRQRHEKRKEEKRERNRNEKDWIRAKGGAGKIEGMRQGDWGSKGGK